MSLEPQYGLSFSHRRAAELGLDPAEAFLALLIHLKPRLMRLSISWDAIAPEPGRYELDSIRWYLDRTEEYGCRVLLTAGITEPDRRGFSLPAWLTGMAPPSERAGSTGQGRLMANVLLMLERVVAALADYDAIDAWQVENEPFLAASRSRRTLVINPSLLKREVEVVREVDARHRPIVVTHSGGSVFDRPWHVALGIADVIGENLALSAVDAEGGRLRRSLTRHAIAGRLRLLALAAARQGKPLWITELQTEAPIHSSTSSSRLMDDMQAHIDLARRSGAVRIYLLGAEAGLISQRRGDQRWWDLARAVLTPSK